MTALRDALIRLRDHGYQPMYNGRPSCPFCSSFVDYEETHAASCVLVAALDADPVPDFGDVQLKAGASPDTTERTS